jgi:flagellar capping protein FliD
MYTTDLEENTKALHKAMPGTSPVFTGVSKLAARMAGYDPENPDKRETDSRTGELKKLSGLLDINPTHLEHLVRNYTGGVGKFFVDTYTTMRGIVEGGISFVRGEESAEFFPEGANRIPVFNRFVHKPYNGSYHSREFYKMRKYLYDWEKAVSEREYSENKSVTEEKVDALDDLLTKMYSHDEAVGTLSDDIKSKQKQIKAKKETLKTVIPKTEKLRYEAEIKELEDEIDAAKKERIGLFRKAYGEMNPLFEKLKISYQ